MRLKTLDVGAERWENGVPSRNSQGAAREEVLLNIGNEQGIVGCEGDHERVRAMPYDRANW